MFLAIFDPVTEKGLNFQTCIGSKKYLISNPIFPLSQIVLAGLIAVACSAPLDDSQNAQILKYESDNIGVDGYRFA